MYVNYQVFITKFFKYHAGYTPISSHQKQLLPTVMLQFYIKLFGKKWTAADSLEQLVCSDTKAVGTPGVVITSVVCFKELFLSYQPEEEAGSAGEQPASNKVDGDDYCSVSTSLRCFFNINQRLYGLKKLISLRFI